MGCSKMIRVDQGSEFISRDLDLLAYQKNLVLDCSCPGRRTEHRSRSRTARLGPYRFPSLVVLGDLSFVLKLSEVR